MSDINNIMECIDKVYEKLGIENDKYNDEKILMIHNLSYGNSCYGKCNKGKTNKNKIKRNKMKKYH